MKKHLTLLILLFLIFSSCEKDDICTEGTTPKLIILFYNNDNQTAKKSVSSLSVWIDGKEKVYDKQTLDSIAIPLDLTQDSALFKFSANSIEDEINFTYTRSDIFVSRSCGYKTIFENIEIERNTTNWIKNSTINNSTIENETTKHITIFH